MKSLLSQILNDQTHREKTEEHASISVIQCRSDSAEEKNAIYMWFQLYIEVLLRMHHKINDREELVDLWRRSIAGSKQEQHELQLIQQFENDYKSEEAIWWYTKESSLYRILNRALREQDFDQLFASRVLITDIAKQIRDQYEKYVLTNNTSEPFQLYRGQLIEYDELEAMRDNKGEYISMNSFFSTSLDRSVALRFLQQRVMPSRDHTKILFEITVKPRLQNKPFAHIKSFSCHKNENEVLIMLGALFYLDELLEDASNSMWIARLSLADENDYRLQETFLDMKEKIGVETNLASLGKILFQMAKYDQVQKCYELMMKHAKLDLSLAHAGLGKAAWGNNDFVRAAQCEQESLNIKLGILPEHHKDLAVSYSRLGHIYCKQNNHEKALEYLDKAMQVQKRLVPPNPLHLGKTYHRMTMAYIELSKFSLALKYGHKALEIRRNHLPAVHQSIASIHHCLGTLYQKKSEFENAVEHYAEAMEIYRKTLPPHHPKISQLQRDIDLVQANLEE